MQTMSTIVQRLIFGPLDVKFTLHFEREMST